MTPSSSLQEEDACQHGPPISSSSRIWRTSEGPARTCRLIVRESSLATYYSNLHCRRMRKMGWCWGPFYDGHEGTAIYNSSFRPFRSPVPFMFVRNGVVGDWKFFLDNKDWLDLWARRFGESGAQALAEELRRLPWRVAHD